MEPPPDHFPDILRMVAPLKKYRDRAAMEASYKHTVESRRFRFPRIPQAVAVIVMALDFHIEDPDKAGDALNVFLFPNFSPSVGLEAALLTWK